MSAPAISILLPAYNSETFLSEAVDSLLNQTFTDFELLIINDGSTDRTEEIVRSYNDRRICYIKNDTNLGLIKTLNKGIELSNGRYIARMDADDISTPDRLLKQYNWLEKNTTTSMVGSHVSFINDAGEVTGEWKEDIATNSYNSIKSKMAWENCIAHPSVMIRSEIVKQYKYKLHQKNTEDYDLWLRMLADGLIIEKVPEKLLLYRVHDSSITGSILRKSNPFFKQYNCKRRFLAERISNKKWGSFETKVLMTTIHNGLMGLGKNIKGKLKG